MNAKTYLKITSGLRIFKNISAKTSYLSCILFFIAFNNIANSATSLPSLCKQRGGANVCLDIVHYLTPFTSVVLYGGTSNYELVTGATAEESINNTLIVMTDRSKATDTPYTFVLDPESVKNGCASLDYNYFSPNDYIYETSCRYLTYYNGVIIDGNAGPATRANIACPAGYTLYPTGDGTILERFKTGDEIAATCMEDLPATQIYIPKINPLIPCPCNSVGNPINSAINSAINPINYVVNQINYAGNPINVLLGNKFQIEEDASIVNFNLTRIYSSNGLFGLNHIGTNWRYDFERKLSLDTPSWITASRTDGSYLDFKLINNSWVSDANVNDKLTLLPNGGFSYFEASSNNTENYNAKGILTSIISSSGRNTSFNYNLSGTIQSIINDIGQKITFNYGIKGSVNLNNVQLPDGKNLTYVYDANNNLISTTYQDGSTKNYLYENSTFKNALTGIVDENGSRYATYTYDPQGRAITSEHAGSVEKVTLTYNNSSTTIVDALGTNRIRSFQQTLGLFKINSLSQPSGSGSADATSTTTYDQNGNVASKIDFNGNKTTYIYDLTKNLEASRTEGLTSSGSITSSTRTIVTTYHSIWRLPTIIEEYKGASISGTPVKRTTYHYDDVNANTNITSVSELDPNSNVSRTSNMSYTYSTAVSGLVLTKTVDGPRTDVNDVSVNAYYADNATCTASSSDTTVINFGCRGQLLSTTDALSHVTYFNRYNHQGQLEEIVDPNGLVTTNTYDARQRITSLTNGSEVTSVQYDSVGQITQLTLPDSSSITYTYDAAHRLTDIKDNLGNSIHYTLDVMGNRIKEDVNDATGTLNKTLSRSYDQLNRLKSVVGIE